MLKYLLLYLVVINITTFFVYGLDKYKARHDLWRIPEATLLLLAAIGGSVGAWAGIYVFHHKTQKIKFTVTIPLLLAVQVLLITYFTLR